MSSRRIISTLLIIVILTLGFFVFIIWREKNQVKIIPTEKPKVVNAVSVVGKSIQGRNINAYIFGTGETHLDFIGGIHGGYEWNTVLLAYKFIDYLIANPNVIPKNLTVTVIPVMNPDGLYQVIGKEGRFTMNDIKFDLPAGTGRFNANMVDLNRNFDCEWQATSTWRSNIVSAGTEVFSEPEAFAIKNFLSQNKPAAVIFWHSQSNAVYASYCKAEILPKTLTLMDTYAKASGYPASKTFDSYVITGDAADWLASINIPAISVELKTHETIEWEQNLAGIKAIFKLFQINSL